MVPFYETKLGLSNRFILMGGKRDIVGEGSNQSRTGKGTGRSGPNSHICTHAKRRVCTTSLAPYNRPAQQMASLCHCHFISKEAEA